MTLAKRTKRITQGKSIKKRRNRHRLLVMDVFEHAYMLDYGLKHADYIDSFFKNIDRKAAESRLK